MSYPDAISCWRLCNLLYGMLADCKALVKQAISRPAAAPPNSELISQ
jgi:hypothetical protein